MTPTEAAPLAGVVTAAGLTLRSGPAATASKLGSLPRETVITVFEEKLNGETKWYRVKTPSGYPGWVCARFVDLRGPKKPRVTRQWIMEALLDLGWSKVATYGPIANASEESSFDPDAVGDNGKAYGLWQWQGPRQAIFRQLFGVPMQDAPVIDQVKFLDYELRHSEKAAGDALKKARTAREAAAEFCRLFERPRALAKEMKERGDLAQQWFDADHHV